MAISREIFKNEGILGLYKGFIPTVLREMPGYFCFFGGYEFSRYMLTPSGKCKDDLGVYNIHHLVNKNQIFPTNIIY